MGSKEYWEIMGNTVTTCQNGQDTFTIDHQFENGTIVSKNGQELTRKADYMTARSYFAKLCSGLKPEQKFNFE